MGQRVTALRKRLLAVAGFVGSAMLYTAITIVGIVAAVVILIKGGTEACEHVADHPEGTCHPHDAGSD